MLLIGMEFVTINQKQHSRSCFRYLCRYGGGIYSAMGVISNDYSLRVVLLF